jgi:hypothetical protein
MYPINRFAACAIMRRCALLRFYNRLYEFYRSYLMHFVFCGNDAFKHTTSEFKIRKIQTGVSV